MSRKVGRVDRKEGGCGGGDGNREGDGDRKEVGMGKAVGGEGETEMGRRGKRRWDFTDRCDGMPGL